MARPPADAALAREVQDRLDHLTKPPGSLGTLESLAHRLAQVQGTSRPRLRAPHAVVFAGDHGATAHGISPYPSAVTAQMVANFVAGGAAIAVFARTFGLELLVVDAGVASPLEPHPRLRDAKVRAGTRDFVTGPALTRAECELALARGAALVEDLARGGCNALVLGEMGIGNTAASALLVHRLAGVPLEVAVGRGAGLDDVGLARKREVLARAAARAPDARTPLDALAEFGGLEIAMLAGALLALPRTRTLALLDGYVVGAAALVALQLDPAVADACVWGHVSAEPGHRALLDTLGVRPLLDLGLRLGEGSGAALAWPLVLAAERMLNEMATFESAGVSGRTVS
ncbi:MAG: nicotinate-nucleotide--dimethylbenzimidazole phosphoribosyltransferase [Steroidobacteraceae bacterium]|nr:nicotinate-nucleotide--dimethylbenzimidazole phosphoribosyltransferase [Steroidobacteraceae bacterium]